MPSPNHNPGLLGCALSCTLCLSLSLPTRPLKSAVYSASSNSVHFSTENDYLCYPTTSVVSHGLKFTWHGGLKVTSLSTQGGVAIALKHDRVPQSINCRKHPPLKFNFKGGLLSSSNWLNDSFLYFGHHGCYVDFILVYNMRKSLLLNPSLVLLCPVIACHVKTNQANSCWDK